MVRSAIDPWLALGVTAIVAVPGPGFENLTNVWQVQLISPLALGLGVVVVLASFAWLVCKLTRRPIARSLLFPAVVALGAIVSLALTGWRRGTITVPALSRYAYITVVLMLPLVAAALDWLVRGVVSKSAARAQFTKVVPVVTGVVLV